MYKNNSSNNTTKDKSQFYEEMLFRHMANSYVEHENRQIEDDIQKVEEQSDTDLNIAKIYKKETKKTAHNTSRFMGVYKMGSAVAVLLITMIIMTMTVPTVRAAMLEFYYWLDNTHMDISAYKEGEVITNNSEELDRYNIELNKEYEVTYLPEGFSIVSESRDATGIEREYYDIKGNTFAFMQMGESAAISIDTENAEVSTVNINGIDAMVAVKESNNTINIVWKHGEYFLSLSSIGVEKEELIKVAESIK